MPIVQITLVEGRDAADIRAMMAEVAAVVARTLDAPPPSIKVIVTEIAPELWQSGTETIAERRSTQIEGRDPLDARR